jgi:hypothetical protein
MDATRTVEGWGWQELLIAIADDAKVQTGQTSASGHLHCRLRCQAIASDQMIAVFYVLDITF